jgi:mannitol/fructose-specific phosphotransferase system IIA component (Ntr-type)
MAQPGPQGGTPQAPDESGFQRVSSLLAPERVRVPLRSRDKDGVLHELVDLIADSQGLGSERDIIYRAVCDRERVLSTGIGEGIALPHAKYNGLSGLVMSAGVSPETMDFGALDGRAVNLFFLLVGPEIAAVEHVRALARISRLMRESSLRQQLVSASDAESFLRMLARAEHLN